MMNICNMSVNEITVARDGLSRLPKYFRDELLKNNSDRYNELTEKQIADISWYDLNEADKKTVETKLTMENLRAILKITNNKGYESQGLDSAGIKKLQLLATLFDKGFKKNTRKKISPKLKEECWFNVYGNVMKAKCYCCSKTDITPQASHGGHVISHANGGLVELKNIIPICSSCNSAMSDTNMDTYMEEQKLTVPEELRKRVADLTTIIQPLPLPPLPPILDHIDPAESSSVTSTINDDHDVNDESPSILLELSKMSSHLERICVFLEQLVNSKK